MKISYGEKLRRTYPSQTGEYFLLKRFGTGLLLACNALIILTIFRLPRAHVGKVAETSEKIAAAASPSSTDNIIRQPKNNNPPFIAIVSCIKSGPYYQGTHYLEESLLPSIYNTITNEEWESYRVELILGYDHDDEYWAEHAHQFSPPPNANNDRHDPIPINFVSIRKDPHGDRPTRIPFNELCQAAYDYGATYIVRINDDTAFVTPGWITEATEALQLFSPPNVGVVGPTCHQGNLDIMTHDFVHVASHYSIFDTYYPKEFDNYFVDDWITKVYGKKRTRTVENWEVKHHISPTRYEPNFAQDELLDQLVEEGRKSVERLFPTKNLFQILFHKEPSIDWSGIEKERQTKREKLQVLRTETIVRVDGPMQEVHLS
mmetsp:Transcript_19/g.22  ORF Transcript_19/g.22 Transcript_19/m.22 type:complete len:375 (+) Transcript_19:83-1207(+)|eukprot:CAMPEP_0201660740 /NCGR_PEP_ID=MMETSP0494-20130426/3306_1 /ASSEMBLY_ACC=CAM_ASM_000839 /TAXON_ID=420259 /ORGANISM="Thalassiosira gravida, Strain GMp14c1" /LENGTH=374 /DNA_ID=CAMNT_0048138693 /DNA_START=77 /DNA_END=1201 /DNA_ORIENTATION=-